MRYANWLGILGIGLCVAILWQFRWTSAVEVTTAPVTAGSITREIVATGTVQPVTTVSVGTQVSGIVQTLAVDYNSIVHAGDVVARLEPSTYEAQLQSAKAALLQAQSDVIAKQATAEDATTKAQRAEALWSRQLIPQSDFDDARVAMNEANADVDAARAAVGEAQAAVHQATVDLSHTIIRSPIDGIVIERDVDVGQTLAASVQAPVLFKIATDLDRMQVFADIDEADIDGLAPGEPVQFEVESYPNETFHGVVRDIRLQPVTDQPAATTTTTPGATLPGASSGTVVSYTTVIDVANANEKLRPGMTAEVMLGGPRRNSVIRIPNAALSFRPQDQVLDVLGEPAMKTQPAAERGTDVREVWKYDGKRLIPVPVHAGLADDRWTELRSGALQPGDTVATDAIVQRRSRL